MRLLLQQLLTGHLLGAGSAGRERKSLKAQGCRIENSPFCVALLLFQVEPRAPVGSVQLST